MRRTLLPFRVRLDLSGGARFLSNALSRDGEFHIVVIDHAPSGRGEIETNTARLFHIGRARGVSDVVGGRAPQTAVGRAGV